MNVKTKRLAFVSLPQTHLLDLAGPAHVFYEAIEYGAPYELFFGTTNHTQISTSSGLHLAQLVPYHQLTLEKGDIIFIPGSDINNLTNNDYVKSLAPFFDWLWKHYHRGVCIGSICTGAFLLASAGFLTNKRCTTHWKYFQLFQEKFPDVQLKRNRLFVEDERILSSAGISAGIDMALFLIERDCGKRFVVEIAREVVLYFRRGEEDDQLSPFLQFRNHLDDRIHNLQDYLDHHFSEKLTLDALADKVHTSPRNLTRRFKHVTGITIGEYIQKIRLEKARNLIKEGEKMEAVAKQLGYNSTSQLYRSLKR